MNNYQRPPASLSAKEAILCWNPGTDQVAVVPWPDTDNRCEPFSMTSLACHLDVRRMSFDMLKDHVFREAMHLIVRDECDPRAVHMALISIKEYCAGCWPDMPVWVGGEDIPLINLFPDMDFRMRHPRRSHA